MVTEKKKSKYYCLEVTPPPNPKKNSYKYPENVVLADFFKKKQYSRIKKKLMCKPCIIALRIIQANHMIPFRDAVDSLVLASHNFRQQVKLRIDSKLASLESTHNLQLNNF